MGAVIPLVFLLVFGFSEGREGKVTGSGILAAVRFAGASAIGILGDVTDAWMVPDAGEIGFAIRQARNGFSRSRLCGNRYRHTGKNHNAGKQ